MKKRRFVNKGDRSGKQIGKSILMIMNAMNSPSTQYVVTATIPYASWGLDYFLEAQDIIDDNVEAGVEYVKQNGKGQYKDILTFKYGRAICNYLLMYGEKYAQKIEPEAYEIYYKAPSDKGVTNDLMYGDMLHPTQLGSYITALTLYSLLYGNPADTVQNYAGGVHEYIIRVDERELIGPANCAIEYNNGDGFVSRKILDASANIAWQTQHEGLVLNSSNSKKYNKTSAWKNNRIKNKWYQYYPGDEFYYEKR